MAAAVLTPWLRKKQRAAHSRVLFVFYGTSNRQARDGNNLDRQFGGDEFDVNVFFLMDENYDEEETGFDGQDDDDGSAVGGDEHQRSRISVRRTAFAVVINTLKMCRDYGSLKHFGGSNDMSFKHHLLNYGAFDRGPGVVRT